MTHAFAGARMHSISLQAHLPLDRACNGEILPHPCLLTDSSQLCSFTVPEGENQTASSLVSRIKRWVLTRQPVSCHRTGRLRSEQFCQVKRPRRGEVFHDNRLPRTVFVQGRRLIQAGVAPGTPGLVDGQAAQPGELHVNSHPLALIRLD